MPYFEHDGLQFYYRSEGQGFPVVWQHGLGSDVDQTFALLEPGFENELSGFQFVGFDARGHGQTRPLGDPNKIGIAATADDLRDFLDARKIDRAVIGGISMGAAITLNFALRYPERTLGLIFSRPAWLDQPFPENLRIFTQISQYIHKHGAVKGLEEFRATPEFESLVRESPDCAQVVVNHFEFPRAEECVVRLERIPHDAPSRDRNAWKTLSVPTLVLANQQDPIHPWKFAETLAEIIPGAELREVTPKSVDVDLHAEDVRRHIGEFLSKNFGLESRDRDTSA
ncbi:alpha/beta hydrolase [Singulisphaera sp. Ch08]|uniref:Alpha/beta hydrolase n=1 Tax=Singulisphaera sp. Ch08 TaxID=3120278 RepID=A0AAU7CD88_9BACT